MSGLPAAALTAVLAVAVAADGFLAAFKPGFLPLLLLALSAAAAAGVGRRMVTALSCCFDEEEKTVAGATLGLGLLALGTFLLAVAGLLKPWAGSAFLGALWLAGWKEIHAVAASVRAGLRRASERPWLCVLIGLPLLMTLWACLVPPHQYDSLVYHMALPQAYVRVGRLHAPPGIVFAHFPQNGEMLFTLCLLMGSDLLAQMFVWLATALSIAWLLTFGRRFVPATAWAAVLVATHSAVLLLSSTTYVEPLVMLWTTGALLSFEVFDGEGGRGPLLLSAVFTGLALGTKYYAGLLAAVLMIRLLARGRWRDGALFASIVTALFAPWLVKNWILVGNPVFPFLYRFFPATAVGWTSELASGYFQVLTEYGHSRGFLRDLASLPILLFRNPLRFGGGMDVLGDLGWDLTLWLWPLGLWMAWRGKGPRGLAISTVLYCFGWFSTGVVLRFLTALAPAMALIGTAGVARWREEAQEPARAVAATAAGVLIVAHLFLVLFAHGVFGTGEVLLALENREEFLSKRLEYYPCAAFARERLGPNDRILVVGEQRGYYVDRGHLPSTVHAPNLYVKRANEAASPADLARALRADGFTHLLFVPREAARLGAGLGAFSDMGAANWRGLEPALSPVYRGPACLVAALGAS